MSDEIQFSVQDKYVLFGYFTGMISALLSLGRQGLVEKKAMSQIKQRFNWNVMTHLVFLMLNYVINNSFKMSVILI